MKQEVPVIPVKDLNNVIDILSNQNANLTKMNAFLNSMVMEKDEEIINLKKELEEAIKQKK
ncbi:hypothetical protein [Metabacillus litoralis]|uniref:hypothetical protein n=1 Tax=Metabacillus litoralis TaxID=152268 RepID=UPI00203D7D2D|nr:hypothetical protein [Metabacillus litoralis]MCM3411222.1 hypothetical protein [Metabacillus litoralis]